MSDKGFVTKGSPEYFEERRQRMQAHVDTANAKLDEIESKLRVEIDEITTYRNAIRSNLEAFVRNRDALVASRQKIEGLIDQLGGAVAVIDTELPQLDRLLDDLDGEYANLDVRLNEAEKVKRRQLHKHERTKTKYKLRITRLDLRQRIVEKNQKEAG